MNTPYAIIPIGITAIILYLLTYTASRLGLFKIKTHRSLWNILLLITFLVTAVLGLYLAIQVNYKLKSPLADRLLVWHVDFGIGMAMIAIFHFLWHLDYYLKLLKGKKESETHSEEQTEILSISVPGGGKIQWKSYIPLLLLGFTSVITQVVLLREFLAVFHGNELIIGVILAVWMTLTGIGSITGQYRLNITNHNLFRNTSLLVLSVLPLITVFLLHFLRNVVYLPGSLIDVFQIILSSIVLLAPFCLLSGFLFSYLSGRVSLAYKLNLIGESYAAESAGSILGGTLLSFILVFFFNTYEVLSLLLLINVLILSWLNFRGKWNLFTVGGVTLTILITVCVFVLHLDTFSKSFLYQNQKVVYQLDTPYGNLCITKTGDQLNFFENSSLMFTSSEPVTNEEDVHYAMVQHAKPMDILLISGGTSGVLKELLKYPVKSVDYVEINPWIIRIGQQYTKEFSDDRIHVIPADPRRFINRTSNVYDVIIINVPEPSTAQLNRYFTIEFFRDIKKITNEQTVTCISLPSTLNYISEESARLNSVIFNTMDSVFTHLLFVPGNKNYLLASETALSLDIPDLIDEKGIQTLFVNSYYLDTFSLDMRSKLIIQNIDKEAPVNKDFIPVGYFLHLRLWLSQYSLKYWIFMGILALILIFVIVRSNIIEFGLFAGGFAASSIEIIILMVFQTIFGYVYHFTGMIITFFMAGLVIGVALYRRFLSRRNINNFILLQAGNGIFAILLPVIFMLIKKSEYDQAIIAIFSVLTIAFAAMTGMLFTAASGLQIIRTTSLSARIYAYDLYGSAIGAFMVSVLMIPLLGIFLSAVVTGIFNLAAALLSFSFRSKYTD